MTNRPLTQEELDLAPKWATHYIVDEEGDVCFKSDDMYEWLIGGQFQGGSGQFITPIPPKPFDIESVEWSDGNFDADKEGECLSIWVKYHDGYYDVDDHAYAELNKRDVIAMAKALGITAEDLK